MFDGKSILITGGTGSFGKQFVRIILNRYKQGSMLAQDAYEQVLKCSPSFSRRARLIKLFSAN